MARYERMLRDLRDRGAVVAGVLVEVDNQKQLLGYDSNGMVNFLSDKVQVVAVYERKKDGSIKSMASLGSFDESKSTPEPEPESVNIPVSTTVPEPDPEPEPISEKDLLKKSMLDE